MFANTNQALGNIKKGTGFATRAEGVLLEGGVAAVFDGDIVTGVGVNVVLAELPRPVFPDFNSCRERLAAGPLTGKEREGKKDGGTVLGVVVDGIGCYRWLRVDNHNATTCKTKPMMMAITESVKPSFTKISFPVILGVALSMTRIPCIFPSRITLDSISTFDSPDT